MVITPDESSEICLVLQVYKVITFSAWVILFFKKRGRGLNKSLFCYYIVLKKDDFSF